MSKECEICDYCGYKLPNHEDRCVHHPVEKIIDSFAARYSNEQIDRFISRYGNEPVAYLLKTGARFGYNLAKQSTE
jgi:hypothetical protein